MNLRRYQKSSNSLDFAVAAAKYAQRNHHTQEVLFRKKTTNHYGAHWTRCPAPSCTQVFGLLSAAGHFHQADYEARKKFIDKLIERAREKYEQRSKLSMV